MRKTSKTGRKPLKDILYELYMIKQTERFHTFYLLHENMDKFILTNIMRTFIA
ncbi:hypothetical protein [Oceanobacillus indicireducens]|uniref:Uncharacterized protein n=1 Tax=Oceanobacillus indicireducens TaxID=1004261 RepID=A0A918CY52_9BACI|nr:hypothetical protein [Oceanobacillus indicireducens]GGN48724.1 hypothetical protein GCM10007971_00650 [Oceanobacillus indicireducens]